jgi:hypothetical protein
MARVGICTTLKDADEFVDDFLAYHFAIGIERVYLFFDDPNDATAARLENDDRVNVARNDETLARRWRALADRDKRYEWCWERRGTTHEPRQYLNTGLALQSARADGLDWLIHIDIDELFSCAGGNVPAFFGEVDRTGVPVVRFNNCEVIPENPDERPFRVGSRFKCPPNSFLRHVWLASFLRESRRSAFFTAYTGHKAAAAVHSTACPASMHGFTTGQQPWDPRVIMKKVQAVIPKLRQLVAEAGFAESLAPVLPGANPQNFPTVAYDEALVLHFPSPTLSLFKRRYLARANGPALFGGLSELKTFPFGEFELGAYEVARTGDDAQLEKYFREQVLYSAEEIAALESRGLIRREVRPSEILSRA